MSDDLLRVGKDVEMTGTPLLCASSICFAASFTSTTLASAVVGASTVLELSRTTPGVIWCMTVGETSRDSDATSVAGRLLTYFSKFCALFPRMSSCALIFNGSSMLELVSPFSSLLVASPSTSSRPWIGNASE